MMATAPLRKELSRADMAKAVSRAVPSGTDAKKIDDKQRARWEALNEFIQERGGWIVTPKYASPIRLEVLKVSRLPHALPKLEARAAPVTENTLPAKLAELGYVLHPVGSVSRVTGSGLVDADVFEFDLPR